MYVCTRSEWHTGCTSSQPPLSSRAKCMPFIQLCLLNPKTLVLTGHTYTTTHLTFAHEIRIFASEFACPLRWDHHLTSLGPARSSLLFVCVSVCLLSCAGRAPLPGSFSSASRSHHQLCLELLLSLHTSRSVSQSVKTLIHHQRLIHITAVAQSDEFQVRTMNTPTLR